MLMCVFGMALSSPPPHLSPFEAALCRLIAVDGGLCVGGVVIPICGLVFAPIQPNMPLVLANTDCILHARLTCLLPLR